MERSRVMPNAQRRVGVPLVLALLLCAALVAVTRPRLRPGVQAPSDVSRYERELEPRPSPLESSPPSTTPRGSRDPLAKAAVRVTADVGAAEEFAPASTDQESDTVRLVVRVQEQGRPVAARLEHFALDSALPDVSEVPPDGTLALRLAPGRVRIVAWSAQALSRPLELELEHDTEAELELLPALPVEGRIVAARDGTPVAGAEVAFWTAAERDVVVSDAQGRFRHPRFPAGGPAQQVYVRAQGFGKCVRYLRIDADGAWKLAAARAGEASVSGSGTPFLELELVPELVVRGRVLDAAGLPLVGARLAAEGYFHARPSVAVRDLAETCSGADGTFELSGLRADIGHALVVVAEGHAQLECELPPATERALGDLSLAPESVLAGLVVDADGVPLADAEVVLEFAGEAPLAASPADTAVRLFGRERRTRTDANGAFLFAGLAATPLVLRAETASGHGADTELFPDGRGQFPPACLQLAALERR